MEVDGQFFKPRTNSSRFFHPPNTLLDNGTLAIGRSVEFHSAIVARSFVTLVRDDRRDAASAKPITHALNAIPLVGGQFLRTCSWTPDPLRNGDAVPLRIGRSTTARVDKNYTAAADKRLNRLTNGSKGNSTWAPTSGIEDSTTTKRK